MKIKKEKEVRNITAERMQEIFSAIEKEIESEISSGIINGAVINVGTLAKTFFEKSWGYADIDEKITMRADTIIDMASVTKVLTSTALAICCDDKLINIDRPFTDYLDQYKAVLDKTITVRDLAMHISGFGQQKHYAATSGQEIRQKLLSVPPPGQHGVLEYSCWNFQLLGMLVEKVSGLPLPDFCHKRIFEPLGMNSTSLGKPVTKNLVRLAKTCGTAKPGEISDLIAFRLYRDGFSAGNAGAFSCAQDLATFSRCMLRSGEYAPGKRLFSRYAFDALTVPKMHSGTVQRSLGWVVTDKLKPSGFSNYTIYHSGWSGQTLFIDIEKQIYAVILTTRTLNEYERAKHGRFKIIGEFGKLLN
ncbi:MAG: serine hydrolase [Victivallaceae bacterium]|nr:serine hydrolase [Victivallaceae bacterium]MDD4180826.1 serine hydrolase [Victivallaceae bacterium]